MRIQQPNVSPLMRELSEYLASAIKKPLPAAVTARAKLHMVDAFAAMISGSRLPPGRKGVAYVKLLGGNPNAMMIGSRVLTSPTNAALANGMCGHADETDDQHANTRTHPGTSVVPAALAIADYRQLTGTEMLRAIVLGYDLCARTLLALGPNPIYFTGFHAGAIGGLFGATAAASALMKLDARGMRYVLSYAAQQTAGLITLFRDSEHIEKAFGLGGKPAHNGVAAALMIANGFTGVEDVYSGKPNFLSAYSPTANGAALVEGLGRDYEIMRACIKRWPVGAPIQGPLHVLNDLIREHKFKAGDVKSLIARLPDKELEIVDQRNMPDISVQHVLALMLVDHRVTFKSAHDYARMKDPEIAAARKRISVVGDPKLTDILRRWRCVMEVTLKDGRTFKHQTMAAKGMYENPLSRPEEEEKALDLIVPVLGKQRARQLLDVLWNFERVKNVRILRKIITA